MYSLVRPRRYSVLSTQFVRRSFSDGKKGIEKGVNKESEGKYSRTVLLPTTDFNQRANAFQREPELQQYWADHKIFDKVNATNRNGSFVLHDGPPYANGDLHIGHALNKILKDFIVKYELLRGKKVSYIPGWDCHGLPIELKVLQSLKSAEKKDLTPLALRTLASNLATSTMASQSIAFQRYGVWGDWSNPYATLHPGYEAQQIRVFGEMVHKGYIYRGKKPVHWSPSSHTALAEAELEYPTTHVSTSVYLGFVVQKSSSVLTTLLENLDTTRPVKIAVWTTTPWTLPANQAVAVNPSMVYSLVTHPDLQQGTYFLVAKDLTLQFASIMTKSKLNNSGDDDKAEGGELSFIVCGELTGAELVGTEYQHPIHSHQTHRVVIGGSYVTAESGTGLVHTAPGHGMDDYLTGQREELELVSPVDDYGRFTLEAGEELCGKEVLTDGNEAVVEQIRKAGVLLHVQPYPHKYPYDWRTGKPTITRTTEQWFASVEAFRDEVIEAIDGVQWVPAIGQNRISTMVSGRKDWCISRQRNWGVPIPVFYHVDSKEVLMTAATIAHVEQVVREHGSDAWWRLEVSDLLPENLRHLAEFYRKGNDTMDVWFDSGTSWAGVLQEREQQQQHQHQQQQHQHQQKGMETDKEDRPQIMSMFPADLYLEGSDQHRGWFQSSLLTSVAATGIAPFKTVLTHGFVLDERGHKMSKSLGNVVDPDSVINGGKNKKTHPAYGADTLRLWVAGVDYTSDVSIGDGIIKQTSDSYRKLRNTLRFLLGSVNDFNPATDAIAVDDLPSLDKYMLGKLTETFEAVDRSYSTYQFNKASSQLHQFAVHQLSNFYLDISKDRLYISSPNDKRRRSCQTVLSHVLEQFSLMMAPLVPHMAEDAFQNLPYPPRGVARNAGGSSSSSSSSSSSTEATPAVSVFERGWLTEQTRFELHEARRWEFLTDLRGEVNQVLELARRGKHIGASQESQVCLYVDPKGGEKAEMSRVDLMSMTSGGEACGGMGQEGGGDVIGAEGVDDLRYVLLVSQVLVVSSLDELVRLCPDYHLLPSSSSSGDGSTKTGVAIGVRKASGKKCNRCWYFSDTVIDNSVEAMQDVTCRSDVCSRCAHILSTTATPP